MRLIAKIIDKNYQIFEFNDDSIDENKTRFFKELITGQEEELKVLEETYLQLTNKKFLTERQRYIRNFNQKLPCLRRITFNELTEPSCPSYIFVFTSNEVYDEKTVISLCKDYGRPGQFCIDHYFNRDDLFPKLKKIGIGQWHSQYELQNGLLSNAKKWKLTFEFLINGKVKIVRFDGDISVPYNFDDFCNVMHIKKTNYEIDF